MEGHGVFSLFSLVYSVLQPLPTNDGILVKFGKKKLLET